MKINIPTRDWELLSEYLDRQLNPGKRARLETRLQREPELRAALDELQHTRTLLRSAPRVKAPRNFTLKPHMVPQRAQRRIYPVFQFASALASILFVIVLVGDLLGMSAPLGQPDMMPAPAAQEAFTLQAEAETLDVPGAEGPVEEFQRQVVPPEDLPEAADPAPPSAMVLGTPIPEDVSEDPAEVTGLAAEPYDLAPMAPEGAERIAVPEEKLGTTEIYTYSPPVPIWRYLQVSFAFLALITGAAALYLKRVGQ